jgi:predicted nuclease of predicted toxin-antitoxin system
MRFLVDAQLPPALARWLTERGHEADHVADKGMAAAKDTVIWEYAIDNDFAIITKDEDFAQRALLVSKCPIIIWIRLPNTRRRELLVWFDTTLSDILTAVERGERLIEVV